MKTELQFPLAWLSGGRRPRESTEKEAERRQEVRMLLPLLLPLSFLTLLLASSLLLLLFLLSFKPSRRNKTVGLKERKKKGTNDLTNALVLREMQSEEVLCFSPSFFFIPS